MFVAFAIYCKTYCNSSNANCSVAQARVVDTVAGAPTTLVQTPAYWISPESSCHCEKNSHIVLRPKHGNNPEREKLLATSYLELLIIDFWHF